MSTTITAEGNLTADPEIRITRTTGQSVCSLRLAVSDRRKTIDGEYADTVALFYEVTVWGALAEHVADSVSKGDRLLVHGTSWDEEWTDRDGGRHVKHVLAASSVGASLRYATARLIRAARAQTEQVEPAEIHAEDRAGADAG
jgi:single-strand DNA-binding protein